jgi:hypothetical protein
MERAENDPEHSESKHRGNDRHDGVPKHLLTIGGAIEAPMAHNGVVHLAKSTLNGSIQTSAFFGR